MPYKNRDERLAHDREYSKQYYQNNKEDRLSYRKTRRKQDRENWRRWYARKKRKEQKEIMRTRGIYRARKRLF